MSETQGRGQAEQVVSGFARIAEDMRMAKAGLVALESEAGAMRDSLLAFCAALDNAAMKKS